MSKSGKSEIELLEEINEKLGKLIGILAIQGKSKDEQIRILKVLGFNSKQTGSLVGIDDSAIRHRKAWTQN